MTTGNPVDPTVSYADVSDVLRYTRNDDANLGDSDIEQIIDQKTRQVEKETPTAFREMTVEGVVVDVKPSKLQKRDNLNRRGFRGASTADTVGAKGITSDRWIRVVLDNDRIRNISKIELYTDRGVNDVTNNEWDASSNEGDWRVVDERDGILEIDYLAFKRTLSGKASEDKFKGARVKLDYNYGRSEIEPDIREAVSKLAFYDLISSDAHGNIRTADGDTGFVLPDESSERFKQDAEEIINKYK